MRVMSWSASHICAVMAGRQREARLRAEVPAIRVFFSKKDVDARHQAGHDEIERFTP